MEIQLPQILFQVVNFSVVLGALWYLLYKPVLKIFAERAKRIEEGQKAAQKAIEQQEKIGELKAKTTQELKKESAKVLQQATKEAEEQKSAILEEAKKQAAAEIERMKQNWEEEQTQRIQHINQQLVDVVIAASEKVIGQSLDKKAHAKLIDSELNQVLKSL
jgi:F-type H+-transporting ATPase subunit b